MVSAQSWGLLATEGGFGFRPANRHFQQTEKTYWEIQLMDIIYIFNSYINGYIASFLGDCSQVLCPLFASVSLMQHGESSVVLPHRSAGMSSSA